MPLERAAYGAHLIVASNMIRAIKAVSTERGRDPRDFALFAFGGNGPLFAAGMAASLGISRVVVPPSAGLFSSFGLLYADVEHHYARTFRRLLRQADLGEIDARLGRARQAGDRAARSRGLHRRAAPACDGPPPCTTRARATSSPCRCPTVRSMPRMATHLEQAFAEEHERTYGHRAGPDEPVELVSIQLVGSGLREGSGVPQSVTPSRRDGAGRPRARPTSATSTAGWTHRC